MKKNVIAFLFVLASLIGVGLTGFYPVALVGGSPIFQRSWKRAEDAVRRISITQSRGVPETAEVILAAKKASLTFLIEDKILQQEGRWRFKNFEELSKQRVASALHGQTDFAKAVQVSYGVTFQDFNDLVLIPQARRDILREELEKENKDFDEWVRDLKRAKKIRLFFAPFSWDGETVR